MGKGPKFVPEGFDGTYAPSGADPDALREMRRMQRDDRGDDPAPASKGGAAGRRAAERRPPPRDESAADEERDDEPSGPGPASRARRGGRPAKENRAQRVVRLTAQVDARLRQLAEFRGIDLNAAVSVAIAEDWRRVFDLEPIAGRRR